MNPRNTHHLRHFGLTLMICLLPMVALEASPTNDVEPIVDQTKSLSGSFVVLDDTAGAACWTPSSTQTLCFQADSYTDDWEWVENLWLLLPSGWTVNSVSVDGSPSCDSGTFRTFSWSFHTPSYEIDIDHQRRMSSTDHCTATYCVDVTTGAGSGDALVSWYWGGEPYAATPHYPCSDDGYTPPGEPSCDESLLPRAVIPDCASLGSLDGTILDAFSSGPTCTPAMVTVDPGGVIASADGAGAYGPLALSEGSYDVTASADGFDPDTVTGVSVIAGATTTQDFSLVRPILDASPANFEATVPTSGSGDETLTLSNLGVSPLLDWSLNEMPPTDSVNPLTAMATGGAIEIEAELADQMRSRGSAGYLIDFRERPDLTPALKMAWEERGRFVVDALQTTAKRTQARVRSYLEDNRIAHQSFWIDNVIIVESSTNDVFDGLVDFDEIEILRARRVMGVIEPEKRTPAVKEGRALEPNISHVHADQVWGLGFDGTGMVVSNIDTGARYTHEVLEPHYRGNLGGGSFDHDYNWLSGDGGASTPVDGHGHGSHTMGTMVGDDGGANQIGMAPGATWIACEGCPNGSCPDSSLLTCAQWITAPYPVGNPSAPDPSKRPHVVNNSWGDCGNSYDNWYQGSIDSWHAAGIYPVFSNGNASNCGYSSPPGCNTVGNPARYGNVTGVGSSGQFNGAYASHSNWGPTDNPDTVNPNGFPSLKPQVVAPGVDIRSSLGNGDSSYDSWAGTSMSAPHVAGLIVLMWQAAPCLTGNYADTEDIIQNTAVTIPYASNCGGEGSGNIPNMATGWGEIDAYAAVVEASAFCNTDWLPWVSESPESGQVAAFGDQDVVLTFTCDAIPGDETGTLRLTTNDPCAQTTDIPLTLHCDDSGGVDLAISKTDGQTSAVPGSPTSYTIIVTNAGPDAAVGATVSDVFSAGLTGVSWSCVAAGGASCAPAGSGNIADTVSVPVGGSLTYTVTATIDPAATGTLSNTATVAAASGVTDLDPSNNGATDNTSMTPQADLSIGKTDGLTAVLGGDPITYTITVGNTGPSDAPGAGVNDTFPADVTGVTWSCAAAGGAACTATGSGDINDTVSLPVGGSLVYTATGTVAQSASGTLSNTASVTPPTGVTDTNPTNDSATDTTTITLIADLHGSITDSVCWVMPGDPTTYTLEVFNGGPADAMGATVLSAPPAILTGVTWTCSGAGGGTCPASGAGDIDESVSMPAGASVTFLLTGTVDPSAVGWLVTEASVIPPAGYVDPTPGDASMSDWDALEPPIFCDSFEGGSSGGWSSTSP